MQDLTTLTINVKDPWKDPANGWDVPINSLTRCASSGAPGAAYSTW